jgi:hypothetical protein
MDREEHDLEADEGNARQHPAGQESRQHQQSVVHFHEWPIYGLGRGARQPVRQCDQGGPNGLRVGDAQVLKACVTTASAAGPDPYFGKTEDTGEPRLDEVDGLHA